MSRLGFAGSLTALLLASAMPAAAAPADDTAAEVLRDCGGNSLPRDQVSSCLERARIVDQSNPSPAIQSLEAKLEQRVRAETDEGVAPAPPLGNQAGNDDRDSQDQGYDPDDNGPPDEDLGPGDHGQSDEDMSPDDQGPPDEDSGPDDQGPPDQDMGPDDRGSQSAAPDDDDEPPVDDGEDGYDNSQPDNSYDTPDAPDEDQGPPPDDDEDTDQG
jgi:hypothetical protein